MDTWIEEFLRCVNNLQIEESVLIKNENLPEKIFRYRPANEHSLDNLKNDTVWLCSPNKYNDPYDSEVTLDSEQLFQIAFNNRIEDFPRINEYFSIQEIETLKSSPDPLSELTKGILKKHFSQNPSILENIHSELLNIFKKLINGAIEKEIIEKYLIKYREAVRLCSFSQTNSSIVLWTHYANNHEGFCVEYNLATLDIDDDRRRCLFPIIYSDKLCDISHLFEVVIANDVDASAINDIITALSNGQIPTPNDDLAKKFKLGALLSPLYKSREWSYEREWRLLMNTSNPGQNYSMPTPSAIYLGARINEDNKKIISDIAASKNIDVYQMKLSKFEFKLIQEKLGATDLSPLEQMHYDIEQKLIPSIRRKLEG